MLDFWREQFAEAAANQGGKHEIARLILARRQRDYQTHPTPDSGFSEKRGCGPQRVDLADETQSWRSSGSPAGDSRARLHPGWRSRFPTAPVPGVCAPHTGLLHDEREQLGVGQAAAGCRDCDAVSSRRCSATLRGTTTTASAATQSRGEEYQQQESEPGHAATPPRRYTQNKNSCKQCTATGRQPTEAWT